MRVRTVTARAVQGREVQERSGKTRAIKGGERVDGNRTVKGTVKGTVNEGRR